MTAADRPGTGTGIAEQDGRAIGVGLRPLATQFVKTVTLAVAFVTKVHGKTAGVEVRAALAVLVHQTRVGKFRTPQVIDLGQRAEGEEMHHRRQEIIRIGRTARDGYHRLTEYGRDAGGTGRIRVGRWHAAPAGAGADGDHGGRIGGTLLEQFDCRLATDLAVDAAITRRDGTFDDQQILALILGHRRQACLLGLMAGGSEERLVVVERDDVENQFFQCRMLCTQHRLGTAGTFLEVQPDHRRAFLGSHRFGHGCFSALRQPQSRRHGGQELQKLALGHAEPAARSVNTIVVFQLQQTGIRHFLALSLVARPAAGWFTPSHLLGAPSGRLCTRSVPERGTIEIQMVIKN